MPTLAQPLARSPIRRRLGKEYFIIKRRLRWILANRRWALQRKNTSLTFSLFKHYSLILRPLKDVEMYLQKNKRTNLSIAIAQIDGILIRPGETFSFWKLVGRPTLGKGYLEGLVLQNGAIGKDTGGGLCQLGNLLFWMIAHSPLTITERCRHSCDVFPDIGRKVPFGAGATLSYNYLDFQFRNDTEIDFQLRLWLDEINLNGELLTSSEVAEKYSVEERNHLVRQEIWGGYSRHNQIFRVVVREGVDSTELLVENHAIMMYNPFLTEKSV